MGELKALSQDVLKNSSDINNYNSEFATLQVQLYQMAETTFNGVSLFARYDNSGTAAVFGSTSNTVSIYTSANGEGGSAKFRLIRPPYSLHLRLRVIPYR